MANPTVTVEIKSIGSKKVIDTLGTVRKAALSTARGVDTLGKKTKKAGDKASKFKNKMTELGKSASLALGPLNGVAARLTAFSGLATNASFKTAAFIGALVGAGGLVFAAVKVAKALDSMRKSAQTTGLSIERFQEFQFVASQAGIEANKFEKAMISFSKRLGEAGRETGAAKDAFKLLLGSLHEIKTIDTDEAILQAADAYQKFIGTAQGAAISANLFSKANQKMANFLALGRKGILDTAEAAHKFGLIIKEDLVLNSTKAVDSLDILGKILKVNLGRVVLSLLPLITRFAIAMGSLGPIIKENIQAITASIFALLGAALGALGGLPGILIGLFSGAAFGLIISSLDTLEEKLETLEARRAGLLTGPVGSGARGGGRTGPTKGKSLEAINERIALVKLEIAARAALTKKVTDFADALENLQNKGFSKAFLQLTADVDLTSDSLENLIKFGNRSTISFRQVGAAAAKFFDQADLATQKTLADKYGLTLEGLRLKIHELFLTKAIDEAQIKIFNETRTAVEKLDLSLSELAFAFHELPADMDLLARAASRAKRAFIDVDEGSQLLVRGVQAAGDGMVDAMTTAGDAMEVLRDTARSIVDDILKTFIRLSVINPLLNNIFNLVGGAAFPTIASSGTAAVLGGGAPIASSPAAPRLAHGGSFRVGGFGGPDSQLVSLHATPGETITATPSGKAGVGGDVIINMNISTGVAATVRSEVLKLAPVLKSLVRRDIAEASRQGGRFNRAVNS